MVVNTVNNSPVVTVQSTNRLGAADVGKIILLSGVGPATTPTNNQDLVAQIVSVANGTSVTLSARPSRSMSQVSATYGTHNAVPFQQCVDACTGPNTTVMVPAGRYLLVSPALLNPALNTAAQGQWPTAVVIQKGGIHFLGSDPVNSVLLGCGAWTLYQGEVYRGRIFTCRGPVTNDAPLIFENLTFDGGVTQGKEAYYNSGPARTTDGAGWDVSHDAVVDEGAPPLHAYKEFTGCTFTHWRGEMVKSVASGMDGFILVTNCSFIDGEASGFNFNFTHDITHCAFSNLDMAMEFYAGYMLGQSVFENSTVSRVRNAIILVGALANRVMPPYVIRGNVFSMTNYGVLLGPARNITISSNVFSGGNIAVATDGYAYQGSGCNSNVLVSGNLFTNVGAAIVVGAGGIDSLINTTVTGNTAMNCGRFSSGSGASTNVVFSGNTTGGNTKVGYLYSGDLTGQWFIDATNQFPNYPVYDGAPKTNIITYANGMYQQAQSGGLHPVYYVDDTHPSQMPAGARLAIQNVSAAPVKLVLSNSKPGASSLIIPPTFIANCAWQSAAWKLIAVDSPVPPPINLRVLGAQ